MLSAFMGFIEPGDEVIIFEPFFDQSVSYALMVWRDRLLMSPTGISAISKFLAALFDTCLCILQKMVQRG